jgi:hypothetical protein
MASEQSSFFGKIQCSVPGPKAGNPENVYVYLIYTAMKAPNIILIEKGLSASKEPSSGSTN